MKPTTFRMSDELAAWYEKNYSSLSAAALFATQQLKQAAEIIGGNGEDLINRLQELEAITKIATREITGMFTREELISMIDALNGTMITREILFVPGWMVMEMQDAEALDATCTRHEADAAQLIAKLQGLSQVQTYALYNLIRGFWDSDDSRDLDRFVQQYAKKSLTYDVHFDDSENSNSKGFRQSIEYCKRYIEQHNGTNESYFTDYKGGTVSIVCNETNEVVLMQEVK